MLVTAGRGQDDRPRQDGGMDEEAGQAPRSCRPTVAMKRRPPSAAQPRREKGEKGESGRARARPGQARRDGPVAREKGAVAEATTLVFDAGDPWTQRPGPEPHDELMRSLVAIKRRDAAVGNMLVCRRAR